MTAVYQEVASAGSSRSTSHRPAVVFFELGGVLASYKPAFRITEYARRAGAPAEQLASRFAQDDFWSACNRGVYSADDMQQRICKLAHCRFTRAELTLLQAAAFEVRGPVRRLARLVSENCRVGILANDAPLMLDAFKSWFPDLREIFDLVLFSCQFGATKPRRELFDAVADHVRCDPEELLLIDDVPENVAGARSAGWDAFRYSGVPQLRAELARRDLVTH